MLLFNSMMPISNMKEPKTRIIFKKNFIMFRSIFKADPVANILRTAINPMKNIKLPTPSIP
jgi:hypothetical protein